MRKGSIRLTEESGSISYEIEIEIPRSPALNKSIPGDYWIFYKQGAICFRDEPVASEKHGAAFRAIAKQITDWLPCLDSAAKYERLLGELKNIPTEELLDEIRKRMEVK